MALIVTAPSWNTNVTTGSLRATDLPVLWFEIPFLCSNWLYCSQMMRKAITGDHRLHIYVVLSHIYMWFSSCGEVQFFPGSVTVGYANGLLTDWRQNCHFPHTIQPWQSENDSLCDTAKYFWNHFHMNLISMRGEVVPRVKFMSKAGLIDNNAGHWGKIQKHAVEVKVHLKVIFGNFGL